MRSPRSVLLLLGLLLVGIFLAGRLAPREKVPLRGVLLDLDQCTDALLDQVCAGGATAVVLALESNEAAYKGRVGALSKLLDELGMELYYWVEVARDPKLAERQPHLVASLSGHPEWRLNFPNVPQAGPGERVVAWPWVSIYYAEAFELQLEKVEDLLAGVPEPRGLILSDLQGAPSACGCGNLGCRWTVDYQRAARLALAEPPRAARFLALVRQRFPQSRILPAWTAECGSSESERKDLCHDVPCAEGRCWPAAVAELKPVLELCPSLALLLMAVPDSNAPQGPTQELGRVLQELQKHDLNLPPAAVLPVLCVWHETNPTQFSPLTHALAEAGVKEWVLALSPIEQSYEPRISADEAR